MFSYDELVGEPKTTAGTELLQSIRQHILTALECIQVPVRLLMAPIADKPNKCQKVEGTDGFIQAKK